jgi:Ni/Fe-hydrogenase subunit HybB-like protein
MNNQQEQFVEGLLNQMPQLSSEQYLKYRRELDDKLARARREEKAMRWIVVGAWLAALALCLGAVLWSRHSGRPPLGRYDEWLPPLNVAAALLLPVGALLLLGLYLFKYRIRVSRARHQAQAADLAEVQRQLNELRAQLLPPKSDQPPSTPPK